MLGLKVRTCMLMGSWRSRGQLFYHLERRFVGGPKQSTCDPRLRKCVWAFAAVVADESHGFRIVGNLLGQYQSVPRAEVTALVNAIQATAGLLDLCTDAAYVLRKFRKCRQPLFFPSSHWDLRSQVKPAQRSRQLRLHKIKSHLFHFRGVICTGALVAVAWKQVRRFSCKQAC